MKQPIEVLIEGNVFQWNARRGIPRVYGEILPRVAVSCPDMHVTVVSQGPFNWWPAKVARIRKGQVPAFSPRWRPWRFWSKIERAVNRLLAEVYWKNTKANVYHSTSYEMPAVPGSSLALVHDMMPECFPEWFDGRGWRRLAKCKKRTVEHATLVLCVSENTRKDVIERIGVDETRCRVSYNGGFLRRGLDEVGGRPAGLPNRPFVLYVGGHRIAYKNFEFLLRGMGAASKAVRGLDVIAAGPEVPTLPDLERYHKLIPGDRIRFLNDCTDDDLAFLYRHCAVFVMPSLYEGFGLPVVEALSCGAPVACSNRASFPEVGGDVVEYFDPESVEEFHHALERALSEGRSAKAVAVRRAHASRFTWEASAQRFAQAVREVAGGRGAE